MMTFTRHDDGTITATGAEETERFSAELLANGVEGLHYDRETNVITLTCANGVWHYKVDRFDDGWGYDDRVVIAHLIGSP